MDGWITIGTKLNTDEFDKQIKDLENKIDSEEKKQELLNNKTKQYQDEIEKAKNKLEELNSDYDKAYAKADKLANMRDNSLKGSARWKRLNTEFETQLSNVIRLDNEIERTEKSQVNLQNKVAQTQLQYDNSTKTVDKLKGKIELINLKRQQTEMKDLEKSVKNAEKGADNFKNKVAQTQFKGLEKNLKSVEKSVNNVKNGITNTIGKIGKMALAVLGVRSAYMALRRASSTLSQYNEQYAKNLEYIQFALSQGLAPVLEWVVSITQTLLGYINALFQTLFGINLFANASSKNFEKMSKSAGGIAKSTKEAKNNLASFDEINVLNSNNNTSGSGGAGGAIAPSFDLANIEVGEILDFDKIGQNIAQKLNEAMKKIDFNKAGKTLGKGINSIIDIAYGFVTTVDWSNLGKSISDILNGLFDEVDFEKVGETLGGGITAIIDIAYGFVTTFDWSEFGKSMSDIVNGIFKKVDFATAAKTISHGLAGVLEAIASFFANTNWEDVADQIWTFFSNIDWVRIVRGMAKALGSALGGFSRFVIEFLIINPAEDLAQYFYDKMEECGGNAWEGFCKGITDWLYNLGRFIVEDMWKPFIENFKNAFGIHSPSTKMAEMGEYIVQGLFNGISGLIDIITQPFKDIVEKIKNVINNIITYFENDFSDNWKRVWNGLKETFSKIWDGIVGIVKGAINLVIGFLNTMISSFETALNWVIDKINILSFEVPDFVPGIGGKKWGFDIQKVKFERIPKLAKGTIVAKPTQAIIGEAGTEAVMPLENNTEWMDILAEKLSSRTGGQEIIVRFEGTMAQFVRELKPHIEVENRRAGARIITGGAY